MILRKKHVPVRYHGMWYAAWMNFAVGGFNLYLTVAGELTVLKVMSTTVSFTVCIILIVLINRKTKAEIWKMLKV